MARKLGGRDIVAAQFVARIEDVWIGDLLVAAADRDGGRVIGDEESKLLDQIVAKEEGLGDRGRIITRAFELGESARQRGLGLARRIEKAQFRIAEAGT